MRKNKIVVVLLLALVFALSMVFAACELAPAEHVCTSKCPDCGKCTNATCTEDACRNKCPGHHCKHVCPDCGGCLDDTCTNPICADNRCICESLIDSAKSYIDGLYKDANAETDKDYELVTSAYIKKTDVTIAWSIEVAEGATAPAKIEVVNGKTMVIISTDEATEARPYTLVGVITAGDDTATVRYERTIPVVDVKLNAFLEDAVTSVTAGKQYVLGLYQKKLGKALYFAGNTSGNYLATTEDIETATAVTLVAVEGGYRLQFQDGATAKYIEVYVYDATSGKTGVGLWEDGSDKMLSPASVWTFDKNFRTLFTTVAEVKYYIGTYSEFNTISRSESRYLTASNVDVSQFPIRLFEKKAEVERNDQEKADYEISKLSIETEIYSAGVVTLPDKGTKYTDVAITWTSDNTDLAAIADGKVTYTLPTTDTTVKLTATATINDKTATKTFDVVVKPLSPITIAEFLAKDVGDTIYLIEGWVVATGGSHTTEGSFVIRDATDAVFSYNKTKLEVGDKVRVYGKRDENKGFPQMGTISVEAVTIAEGETMPEYTPVDLDASTIQVADITGEKFAEMAGTYYKVTGGTLKISGNYNNVNVGSTQIFSIFTNAALQEQAKALDGKEIVFYGYVRGGSTGSYTYISLQINKIEAAGGAVVEPTDEEIVATDKAALSLNESYAEAFDLPTTGANGTTITWALKEANEKVTITAGKVTFTVTENTSITLVATITKGEATDTKEFAVNLLHVAPKFSVTWSDETITSVKNGETAIASGDKVDLNTVLTITVTPAEGYKLASYKIGDSEADTSVEGETSFTITVTADSVISVQYVEMYPEKTIAEFKALSTSDKTEYKVTGIVTNMDGKAIFIQDAEGNALYLYDFGEHKDGVAVGKKVTYRGTRGEYKGLKQMASPVLVKVEDTEEKITAIVLDEATYKAVKADDACKLVSLNNLVFVSGTIAESQSLNFTLGATDVVVRIEKNGDSANIIAALKNIKAGDTISLENVNIGWFSGAQIALSAATSVMVKELTAEEKVARVVAALESAGVTIDAAGKEFALPTYDDVTLTWTLPEGTTVCKVTEDGLSVIATALPAEEAQIKATATFTIDGANGTAEVEITIKSASAPAQKRASIVIKDYATANDWKDATQYKTANVDDNITVTVAGETNTGKYYKNGNEWRTYQTESPKITVSAKEGYTIVSLKVTYNISNSGYLLNGETKVESNTVIEVNANSIVLGVGGTATKKNGQVKITAIEVVYKAA